MKKISISIAFLLGLFLCSNAHALMTDLHVYQWGEKLYSYSLIFENADTSLFRNK
ncbi:MAG: hypothetical protein OET07_13895 [Desulfobacteraceae bacterium]|nr:hypothetical protein [Desulfobacteraceae bacterium]